MHGQRNIKKNGVRYIHLAGPDVTAVFIITAHKNTLYVTLLRITAIFSIQNSTFTVL
jgi:hypothetical protein